MADTIADITVDQAQQEELIINVAPSSQVGEETDIRVFSLGMSKTQLNDIEYPAILEIRPNLRRTPNETPFIINMVDSTLVPYGITIGDDIVIGNIKFYPNPDSMVINSSKIITRYNTMTRWVEEHWGDEIDTITFSGSSFAFFDDIYTKKAAGMVVKNRNITPAYSFMRELNKFFRQNGCIYQNNTSYSNEVGSGETRKKYNAISDTGAIPDPVNNFLNDPDNQRFTYSHPREGLIKERLYIRLSFDYVRFLGYFDTFDIIEDSTVPYRLTYNIVFKSEKTTYLLG